MTTLDEVLEYWLDEVGPEGWYRGGDELDSQIRERFLEIWERVWNGECDFWRTSPSGALAYIVLTDQFPRNMFRSDGKAFASDGAALAASKAAIAKRWDMRVDEPARHFFYMPLMHSECLADQDRCVRLMLTRLPETGQKNLPHARAHREVVRRFGRFPTRNEALGRVSTASEADYLAAGGYRKALEMVGEA